MEQIHTPEQITKLPDHGSQFKAIHRYSHDVAMTAVIISHAYFDQLQPHLGVMNAADICTQLATQFVEQHHAITEWEHYLAAQQLHPSAAVWEDYLTQWVEANPTFTKYTLN